MDKQIVKTICFFCANKKRTIKVRPCRRQGAWVTEAESRVTEGNPKLPEPFLYIRRTFRRVDLALQIFFYDYLPDESIYYLLCLYRVSIEIFKFECLKIFQQLHYVFHICRIMTLKRFHADCKFILYVFYFSFQNFTPGIQTGLYRFGSDITVQFRQIMKCFSVIT